MATATDLKSELQRSVADLRKLVREIRVDVRTAGEGARKRWSDFLEPQLTKTEKLVHDLSEVSRAAAQSTAAALGAFQASFKAPASPVRRRRPGARVKVGSRN